MLEALMAAHVGPVVIADVAITGRMHPRSAIHRRATVWQDGADGTETLPVGVGR